MKFNRHHPRPACLIWGQHSLRYLSKRELDDWCAAITAAKEGKARPKPIVLDVPRVMKTPDIEINYVTADLMRK